MEKNSNTVAIKLTDINAEFTYLNDQRIKGSIAPLKATVFKGFFNGTTPIALKRYQIGDEKIAIRAKRDLEFLSSPDKRHENIIRYFGSSETEDFM